MTSPPSTFANASQIVTALAALAQETRLQLYRLLVQAGPAGQVVSQLAEALQIPPATLSFHLKTLAHGGLVRHRQEGRFIRYTANFEAMHGLVDYLTENCCGSTAAACAPACNDASDSESPSCAKGSCS